MSDRSDIGPFLNQCAVHGVPWVVYQHLGKSGEAFVSGLFRSILASTGAHKKLFDGAIPEIIEAFPEYPVPRGRVDYMLVHADGSVTVCELKDGAKGKQHVLSGLGQCIGYAIQIGMAKAEIPKIRKALVFSSWGKPEEELIVIDACLAAGVIPVPMGPEDVHRESAIRFLEGYISNGHEKVH